MIIADEFVNKILSLKGILYVAGNGGSASIADHIACDFMKIGIPTVSLVSNSALITMIANDYGYQYVFDSQLHLLLKPEDMVLLVSSSGNSLNIVSAADLAIKKDVPVLGFTGFDGGMLQKRSSINYHVESYDYGFIETEHTRFFHLLTKKLKEKEKPLETMDRFWSKVDKTGYGNCWTWIGYVTEKGIGMFYHRGKNWGAARFLYERTNNCKLGRLDFVFHTCDDAKCVNPEHLYVASHKHMYEKRGKCDRFVKPRRYSEEQRAKVISLSKSGLSLNQICRETGIPNSGTVWKILNRP